MDKQVTIAKCVPSTSNKDVMMWHHRNHSRNSSKPNAKQRQASEPVPLPGPETTSRSVDTELSDNSDLDLPIALRKDIKIPEDIKEALADPKWRLAVQEEMEALEKNMRVCEAA